MTLLLTSSGCFVTEEASKYLARPLRELSIAYITTAKKGVKDKSYVTRRIERMKELNFNFDELDIEGKNIKQLQTLLKGKDVIYVEGGSPLYLIKHVRLSGFDKLVKKLIKQDVLCIGSSAGTYITCPTLEMAFWKDTRRPTFDVTDLSGLSLIPFIVSVHYEEKYKNLISKKKIKISKFPVRILTDERAFLVTDKKITLVGKGPEVLF